nr:two-component sensor histidine kinase [Lachnospiraceae bacterium]
MKQKINLRLGFIALVAIVATTIGTTMVYYSLFQKQVREDLKQNAALLEETEVFQQAYENDTPRKLNHLVPGKLRITWINKDGKVLFDNDTKVSGLSNHMDRPEIKEAFKNGEGECTRRSDTMNMNTFYYAILLDNGTVLRVSTQARTITNVLINALPVIGGIAVLVLFGCVFIGHFLTRQLMKPLEIMAENLDEVGTPAYKELEPFAEKIRTQHENILAAARSRQDFTANVSHELKTPITAISGYAEIIENHLYDEESEAHIAKQIKHNADRLLSLVNDIIQLSELDHKNLKENFETVDLYRVATECVNDLVPMASQKQISLTCEGVSAGIHADKSLIREMIDNLVQNAIRYNKEQGSVTVHVTIENGHPVLM